MPEAGQTLSHYRLVEKIGEGGMGVVWRAEDTKLRRDVALKFLPEAFASDPVRLERFQREAEVVAALNYPHIVTIYSVEQADGHRFLTMEFVDGESLDHQVTDTGLPSTRLFDVGIALAGALAAAHQKGIVHRDLKPANVMVDREGMVKVLDFGLAKLVAEPVADALQPEATTKSLNFGANLTGAATVLGTVPYMSPEQVQGQTVDHRTDIFSLGVVLYELATGQRPFHGKNVAALISSIMRDSPLGPTEARKGLPRQLQRIIAHCLEKDPELRFQTAKDVRNELEQLKRELQLARAGAPLIEKPSIAVLAFSNFSSDPDQEYFSDGISDDIITELCRFPDLFVIARNSTFTYKGKSVDVRNIAQELGVRYILEGSIRRTNDRIRINAQLIDAATGRHIWAERYDRMVVDVFDVQEEVCRKVVASMAPQIEVTEMERSRTNRCADIRAYDLALRAKSELYDAMLTSTPSGLEHAIEIAEQSIEQEPVNVQAFWVQAFAYFVQYMNRWCSEPNEALACGTAALDRLFKIDSAHPAALTVRGGIRLMRGEYDEALIDYQRAHALNPNDAWNISWMAEAEAFLGLSDDAREHAELSLRLSPKDTDIGFGLAYIALARAYFSDHRYDEAKLWAKRAIGVHSNAAARYMLLIASCGHLGDLEEVESHVSAVNKFAPEVIPRVLLGDIPMYRRQEHNSSLIEGLRKAGLTV